MASINYANLEYEKIDGVLGNIWLNIWNTGYRFFILIMNIPIYLKYPNLLSLDMVFYYYYLLFYPKNKQLVEQGTSGQSMQELTYGETPYFTMERILKHLSAKKTKFFLDLGCGKGKTVFFVNRRYQWRTAGVDIIPTYIRVANHYAHKHHIHKAKFLEKNIIETKFSNASVVYITFTCLSTQNREKIIEQCEALKKGSVVITVTHPIQHARFKEVTQFDGWFSWGKGRIFIYKKM